MTTFLIVKIKVKSPELLQQYLQQVPTTARPFGAEILVKGKQNDCLGTGVADHQMTVVIQFPDSDQLKAWFNSSDYQALIPLREKAAEMTFSSYQSI